MLRNFSSKKICWDPWILKLSKRKLLSFIQTVGGFFLSLHRALWNLYIVHSPTNALLLNLEKFKIHIKIHINIAPTCFGLQPSSGSLYRAWLKSHFCLLCRLQSAQQTAHTPFHDMLPHLHTIYDNIILLNVLTEV